MWEKLCKTVVDACYIHDNSLRQKKLLDLCEFDCLLKKYNKCLILIWNVLGFQLQMKQIWFPIRCAGAVGFCHKTENYADILNKIHVYLVILQRKKRSYSRNPLMVIIYFCIIKLSHPDKTLYTFVAIVNIMRDLLLRWTCQMLSLLNCNDWNKYKWLHENISCSIVKI